MITLYPLINCIYGDTQQRPCQTRAQQALSRKGQRVNVLGVCKPSDLCYNGSASLFLWQSGHRQYINRELWLSSNKIVHRKPGSSLGLLLCKQDFLHLWILGLYVGLLMLLFLFLKTSQLNETSTYKPVKFSSNQHRNQSWYSFKHRGNYIPYTLS